MNGRSLVDHNLQYGPRELGKPRDRYFSKRDYCGKSCVCICKRSSLICPHKDFGKGAMGGKAPTAPFLNYSGSVPHNTTRDHLTNDV